MIRILPISVGRYHYLDKTTRTWKMILSPQPRVRANTLLGTMLVSQTGNDPELLPVIIQMAPVVMAILYHNLQGLELADNTVPGDLVCQESALQKEGTDVEVLVLQVHLYTKILTRYKVSVPSLLRGAWLAPQLRQLHVMLPDSGDQVLRVMRAYAAQRLER